MVQTFQVKSEERAHNPGKFPGAGSHQFCGACAHDRSAKRHFSAGSGSSIADCDAQRQVYGAMWRLGGARSTCLDGADLSHSRARGQCVVPNAACILIHARARLERAISVGVQESGRGLRFSNER